MKANVVIALLLGLGGGVAGGWLMAPRGFMIDDGWKNSEVSDLEVMEILKDSELNRYRESPLPSGEEAVAFRAQAMLGHRFLQQHPDLPGREFILDSLVAMDAIRMYERDRRIGEMEKRLQVQEELVKLEEALRSKDSE